MSSLSHPDSRPVNPRQGSSSTQTLVGFSEGPRQHHQHQLANLFEQNLPTPGPSTRGKVAIQPNHWTDSAKDRASIISISWKTLLSSLSQLWALQPAARFQFNPTIGRIQRRTRRASSGSAGKPLSSTRVKVPVQPDQWTDSAKDPASIRRQALSPQALSLQRIPESWNMGLGGFVLGSLILYLKGMRRMMFQLSGFCF